MSPGAVKVPVAAKPCFQLPIPLLCRSHSETPAEPQQENRAHSVFVSHPTAPYRERVAQWGLNPDSHLWLVFLVLGFLYGLCF